MAHMRTLNCGLFSVYAMAVGCEEGEEREPHRSAEYHHHYLLVYLEIGSLHINLGCYGGILLVYVSMRVPGYPGLHSENLFQKTPPPKSRPALNCGPPAFAFQVLGLQVCTTMPREFLTS